MNRAHTAENIHSSALNSCGPESGLGLLQHLLRKSFFANAFVSSLVFSFGFGLGSCTYLALNLSLFHLHPQTRVWGRPSPCPASLRTKPPYASWRPQASMYRFAACWSAFSQIGQHSVWVASSARPPPEIFPVSASVRGFGRFCLLQVLQPAGMSPIVQRRLRASQGFVQIAFNSARSAEVPEQDE